jgi:hypothetical protein
MKTNPSVVLSVRASLLAGGMLMALTFASAGQTQPDSVIAVVAEAQQLPLVAPQDRPPIGTSGYYGAQLPVTNDVSGDTTHTVSSSQPIGVQAYGLGYTDAYAYFGGLVK